MLELITIQRLLSNLKVKYMLFGLHGNTIRSQKANQSKHMPPNRLDSYAILSLQGCWDPVAQNYEPMFNTLILRLQGQVGAHSLQETATRPLEVPCGGLRVLGIQAGADLKENRPEKDLSGRQNTLPQIHMEAHRRPYIEDSSLKRGPSPLPC